MANIILNPKSILSLYQFLHQFRPLINSRCLVRYAESASALITTLLVAAKYFLNETNRIEKSVGFEINEMWFEKEDE